MQTAQSKGFKYFSKAGFTLIELLVVISVVVALAVAVSVALNPGQRLKDARDARRTADVDSLLTAIHQSIVDNKGTSPTVLASLEKQLGTAASGCAIATGGCTATVTSCADLTTDLAKYLKSIPLDPLNGTAGTTKYAASQDTNGIVTIKACGTEGTVNVSGSR